MQSIEYCRECLWGGDHGTGGLLPSIVFTAVQPCIHSSSQFPFLAGKPEFPLFSWFRGIHGREHGTKYDSK